MGGVCLQISMVICSIVWKFSNKLLEMRKAKCSSNFDLISNSKGTPAFSNILDGMRELNKQRELNELKFKQLKNR